MVVGQLGNPVTICRCGSTSSSVCVFGIAAETDLAGIGLCENQICYINRSKLNRNSWVSVLSKILKSLRKQLLKRFKDVFQIVTFSSSFAPS